MGKLIDLTDKKFGKLTVIKRHEPFSCPVEWDCVCDCGNTCVVNGARLRNGMTKSCGCMKNRCFVEDNPKKKHGESNTLLYRIWEGMLRRCNSPKNKSYERYGGRGIKVCEEWQNDFVSFRDWSIANGYEHGLTLDRIDNSGNYEPSNCRWATAIQQANNRRSNRLIEYNGKTKTVAEWARFLDVPYGRLQARLYNGWPLEEVFNTPKLKARRKYGASSIDK